MTSLRRRWLPQVRDLAALAPASWPDCNDVFAEAPLTATRLAVPRCSSRRRLAPLAALLRDAVLAPLKAAGLNAVALAVAAAFEVSHGTGMTYNLKNTHPSADDDDDDEDGNDDDDDADGGGGDDNDVDDEGTMMIVMEMK